MTARFAKRAVFSPHLQPEKGYSKDDYGATANPPLRSFMSGETRRFLGGLSPTRFLKRYWQQQALLVRSALDPVHAHSLIDGDTLAGLACEPDTDARLVVHDPESSTYDCHFGPFSEADFADLPTQPWTLLVRPVDRYLDSVSALRHLIDFLPTWRLDDMMVSYATEGGGVGPHFDQYDVFLVQIRGRRHWATGASCGPHTILADHPDLRLLASFQPESEYVLAPGDLLYLPPGISHEGIASTDDCMTCSIGFRAPSRAELLREAVETICADLGENQRFEDDRDEPGTGAAIGPGVERALYGILSDINSEQWEAAIVEAFGRLVTESGLEPTVLDDDVDDAGNRPAASIAVLAPHCRAAHVTRDGATLLFVDGQSHPCSIELAAAICSRQQFAIGIGTDADRKLVWSLLQEGQIAPLPCRITASRVDCEYPPDRFSLSKPS